MSTHSDPSRRRFIKSSGLAVAGAAAATRGLGFVGSAHAADDGIRVGVIGCGGRGTGAALNVLQAATNVIYPTTGYHTEDVTADASRRAEGVDVVALADLFPDRLTQCREQLGKVGVTVPDEACFTGFDAYAKVLAREDVNYVVLACPPHFRPTHFEAAVAAGKHIFIEKPIAVDAPGVRRVLAAGEQAKAKGLGVVAGTQRRHEEAFVETMQRLHEGAIGRIHTCRTYFNVGLVWVVDRQPGWSDMEFQLRNWVHNTWISGDHIAEQHLHSLDAANWALGGHPLSASGMGGRQTNLGNELYGDTYDHFAVEYEYADGVRMFSQCRQMDGCEPKVATFVEGSEGHADCSGRIWGADGKIKWRYRNRDAPNPYEQEHLDLIQSIQDGKPLNEIVIVAEATLTGIMGRESAYAGRTISWQEVLDSKRDYSLEKYEFGERAIGEIPIPGKYEFV